MKFEYKRLILLTAPITMIAACVSSPIQVEKAQLLSPSPSLTKIPSQTVTQSATPHIRLTPTTTPTAVDGAMTRSEIEDNIDRWVNGDIPISDDDRLLDEVTSSPLELGLLARDTTDTAILIYYGLGYTVINDNQEIPYVVIIAGFEDRQRARFTLPIHAGNLFEECGDIFLRIWKGRRINRMTPVLDDIFITPLSLLKQSDLLTDTMVVSYFSTGSPYRTGSECRNISLEYFVLSSEASTALLDFFECDLCTLEDMPPLLRQWTNSIPPFFSNQMLYTFVYNGTAKD